MKKMKNIELIATLQRAVNNAEAVYVRTQVNGKWGAHNLLEMNYDDLQEWLINLIKESENTH